MTISEPMIPTAPLVCPTCSAPVSATATTCSKCGSSLVAPPENAEFTALLAQLSRALDGRYELGEPIGSGRGGVAVAALHIATKRPVVVKVAWNDSGARTRVLRETVLTAKVGHPAALAVRDIQAPEPMLVVEMPHATGGTLRDLLAQGQPVPYERVLAILRSVGDALDAAHAQGIIHGGLQPVKILLDEKGDPLVSDFEIRVPPRADWDITRPSEAGAQAYMPLEQRHDSSSLDGRIDQYALSIIAYELLRGRPTWRINDEGVLEIDAIEVMVHRAIAPGVPLSASMAIKRATAKDPAFRYSSAGAFVRAFSGETVEAQAKEHIHRDEVAVQHRRSWMWVAVPATLGIALLATQPTIRDKALDVWYRLGSNASKDRSNSDAIFSSLPTDKGSSTPSTQSGGGSSTGSTNTRVGDSTARPGPLADPYPRNQTAASNTRVGEAPSSNQSTPARSRTIIGSPAQPLGAPASKGDGRRSSVAGEIVGAGGARGTAPASSGVSKEADGVVVVTVNADARGVVIIDGRPRGQSPLTLRLSPGRHVVSIRGTATFTPATTTITVAAGDTSRATFDVKR